MKADRKRLAKLIGLSDDAISEHIAKGVIGPDEFGMFDASECFKRISEFTVTGKVKAPIVQTSPNLLSLKRPRVSTKKPVSPKENSAVTEAIKKENAKANGEAQSKTIVVEVDAVQPVSKSHSDVNMEHLIQRATIRKMIVDGVPRITALNHMTTKMGMTLPAAQRYYIEVTDDFRKIDLMDRTFEINRARERFEDLYFLARDKKDYRSATVILQQYLEFFGVQPDALNGENEEHNARPQIYLPSNGRDDLADFVEKPE